MTDERSPYNQEYGDASEEDVREEDIREERDAEDVYRRRRRLVVNVIALVVAILILLMLRGYNSFRKNESRRGSSANRIVSVDGAEPVEGQISLWLSGEANVQDVISSAGVTSSEVVDMGGDRFVITVPDGQEADSIRKLLDAKGVYDAGRVYAMGAPR